MTDHPTFVAYDYLTIAAPRELESLHADTYRNFGWDLESRAFDPRRPGTVVLKLKRDRRVKNRAAVMELQRRCAAALDSIAQLERSKSAAALQVSLGFGIVGSALMAVSVFAITDWDLPALTVIAGALGLLGWTAGYFSHARVQARRAATVAPLIDEQYDVVYATSEEAATLLAGADA